MEEIIKAIAFLVLSCIGMVLFLLAYNLMTCPKELWEEWRNNDTDENYKLVMGGWRKDARYNSKWND